MGGKEPECCPALLLTSSKSPRKAPEPMARWQQPSISRVPETNVVSVSPLLGKSLDSFKVVLIRAVFSSSIFLGNSNLTDT